MPKFTFNTSIYFEVEAEDSISAMEAGIKKVKKAGVKFNSVHVYQEQELNSIGATPVV